MSASPKLKRGKRPNAPVNYVANSEETGRPKPPHRSKSSGGTNNSGSPRGKDSSGLVSPKPDRKPPGRSKSSTGTENSGLVSSKPDRKPPGRSKSSTGTENSGLVSPKPDRKPPGRSKSSTGTDSSGLLSPNSDRKSSSRARSSNSANKSNLDSLSAHLAKIEGGDRKTPRRSKSGSICSAPLMSDPTLPPQNEVQEQQQRYRQRTKSVSPTRAGTSRGRSLSPTKNAEKSRGRSKSIDAGTRASRGRSLSKTPGFEYPSQRPKDNGVKGKRKKMIHGLSMRKLGAAGSQLTWCKLAQYVIPALILIGAAIGVVYATGNGDVITDTIDKFIPTFDNSELKDPFRGTRAPSWPSKGKGVKLTFINALTEDWQLTFALAMADWRDNDPHSVEIFDEMGAPDPDCSAPEGKVIVCNGNYGDTKWRGALESMSDNRGKLILAEAKLNDYYLANMEKGAWQWTMCHELGHALGLGHTDEDFENEDLGDCMDYTNHLDENKHPSKLNYDTLFNLYGSFKKEGEKRRLRHRPQREPHVSPALGTSSFSTKKVRSKIQSTAHNVILNDGNQDFVTTTTPEISAIPDYIKQRKREAVKTLLERTRSNNEGSEKSSAGHIHQDGWKLLHRKLHGEEHEMDLGEGYTVHVQLLLDHE